MFTAGICTTVTRTPDCSCMSSQRSDSVNPLMRVLGAAVGRLQRDAALPERGTDLHDRAGVARPHPRQRHHGAVHEPEVADLGDPAELLRGDLRERCEHRGERHVDPDVDGAERRLDLGGGLVQLRVVGDVGRHRERLAAGLGHILRGTVQASLPAGDQPHAGAAGAVEPGGGPGDARAGAGDDNCLGHGGFPSGITGGPPWLAPCGGRDAVPCGGRTRTACPPGRADSQLPRGCCFTAAGREKGGDDAWSAMIAVHFACGQKVGYS